jgi:adenosine deaminase
MNNYQARVLRVIASLLFGCSITFAQDQTGSATTDPSNSTGVSQLQTGSSHRSFALTAEFYRSIVGPQRPDIAKLNLFLTRMPKGGDLHNHYSGSIYAETYLDWVQKKEWLIDECTLQIVKTESEGSCKQLTVPYLKSDASAYRKLLGLCSDKDFGNHIHMTPPPDQIFFNTFGFFEPIADDFIPTGLRILKQRALAENVGYIETTLSQVGVDSKRYFTQEKRNLINQELTNSCSQKETDLVLEQIFDRLVSNEEFNSTVDRFVDSVQRNHQGIDDEDLLMRYQTYAVRVLDPLSVFLDLLSGYMAAERSPLVVGVNIVAPEKNYVALRDYTLHMRMYNYL